LRCLWPALCLAAQVGALLGGGSLVLGALPSHAQRQTVITYAIPAMKEDTCIFPVTRPEALRRLDGFLSRCASYAARRNFVELGHGNVSRLSAALRLRTLLEGEVRDRVLAQHSFETAEKFLQELYWRLYWKGWLEMRPEVWRDSRERLAGVPNAVRDRAAALERGESGVAIMDHFARELVETGYLHNHARMWFASFWVHAEKLPWELGADFFFRHLIDGDAASNTLSWRWVAGLHTPGKQYLVRRSNLERYCDGEQLAAHSAGLEKLERIEPWRPDTAVLATPPAGHLPGAPFAALGLDGPVGLWIHEDDLSPERSECSGLKPTSIGVFLPEGEWRRLGFPEHKQEQWGRAMADAAQRAGVHFDVPAGVSRADSLPEALAAWAARERLASVVAIHPFVGPVTDQLGEIRTRLAETGCRMELFRRSEDSQVMRLASAGFFGFWKKCLKADLVRAKSARS
jgi:hypothetical protein